MHVTVDRELCFRHARCVATCPEVFGIDGEGYAQVLVAEVPTGLVEQVRACVAGCPEGAIELTEA